MIPLKCNLIFIATLLEVFTLLILACEVAPTSFSILSSLSTCFMCFSHTDHSLMMPNLSLQLCLLFLLSLDALSLESCHSVLSSEDLFDHTSIQKQIILSSSFQMPCTYYIPIIVLNVMIKVNKKKTKLKSHLYGTFILFLVWGKDSK